MCRRKVCTAAKEWDDGASLESLRRMRDRIGRIVMHDADRYGSPTMVREICDGKNDSESVRRGSWISYLPLELEVWGWMDPDNARRVRRRRHGLWVVVVRTMGFNGGGGRSDSARGMHEGYKPAQRS